MNQLLPVLDLAGTFVFAISGAMAGVNKRLDIFGVAVLAFAAGNAGGILRDVLIGATPPAAIGHWRYVVVSLIAALVAFFGHRRVERIQSPVSIFDAAGLALFAVVGARKALDFGLHPIMAAVLGMLTGIGGGIVRDILLARIPAVLHAELYAVAALAGAAVVVLGAVLALPPAATAIAGAALCFGLRFMALRHGWRLPVPRLPD
ncbi:trimeric intracellular cation channel family protein [Salinisphaera sp. RV14]|uniref:trimeric intracellular cation channel family protein n=1 Tax=unclassified Salinisphaera TaxID=2649847 RepID=UPI003F827372